MAPAAERCRQRLSPALRADGLPAALGKSVREAAACCPPGQGERAEHPEGPADPMQAAGNGNSHFCSPCPEQGRESEPCSKPHGKGKPGRSVQNGVMQGATQVPGP